MNITQLQHFLSVCRFRNITKAAEHLYLTQQGLSRSVKSLEKELGVPLFIRTVTGVIPTPYAEAILDHVKEIIEQYHAMDKKIRHMISNSETTLHIDCDRMILDFFPHGTQNTIENILFPNISLIYHDVDEQAAMDHLFSEETDLAFLSRPADESGLRLFPLKQFPILAMINTDNPLSEKESLSLCDLQDTDVISFSGRYNIYHRLISSCKEEGIVPHIAYEVSNALHMYFLCKENEGIGICPAFYIDYLPKDQICLIPFEEEHFTWQICIAVKEDRELTPVIRSYIRAFKSISAKALPSETEFPDS